MGTLTLQSDGSFYINTVIGTAARPDRSSLYQMLQPNHQRPVYQLHVIRCGTIIASALSRVNVEIQDDGGRHTEFRKKIFPVWIKIFAPKFVGR